jgi:hypothetical protein
MGRTVWNCLRSCLAWAVLRNGPFDAQHRLAIVGCFAVGAVPTGSTPPVVLRKNMILKLLC